MINQLENTTEYLNNLFSDKDFNFLSSTDKDLNELKNKIENQENKKENILIFFNKLKETLDSDITFLNKSEIKNIIEELENVFKAIGDNITLLNNLEDSIKQLNQDVINLLVSIDTNSDETNNYFDEIQNIKEKINSYSTQLNESNSKILLNDIKIDTFITSQTTQNYLNTFDINIPDLYKSNEISSNYNTTIESSENLINTDNSDTPKVENNLLLVSEKLNKVLKILGRKRYGDPADHA